MNTISWSPPGRAGAFPRICGIPRTLFSWPRKCRQSRLPNGAAGTHFGRNFFVPPNLFPSFTSPFRHILAPRYMLLDYSERLFPGGIKMRICDLIKDQDTYQADLGHTVLETVRVMVDRNIGAVP